jgi:hypothetical protein
MNMKQALIEIIASAVFTACFFGPLFYYFLKA